jgi:hypothetical protein
MKALFLFLLLYTSANEREVYPRHGGKDRQPERLAIYTPVKRGAREAARSHISIQ